MGKVVEKVGILIVSYGAREAAILDAFLQSTDYKPIIYVADKQKNPFNVKWATEHVVIPNLDVKEITKFVERRRDKIDFGIIGPEKPIINGLRELIEEKTNIPIISPTKQCAIEASKISQRLLLEEVAPDVNPKFRIFNFEDLKSRLALKKELYTWLNELDYQSVVKPDAPAAGKGVGVWGDHFTTKEELFEHFLANLQYGPVIVEEKVEGEEISFQAFCDGKSLVPLPDTRDYKRAFEGDKGPNTGGMGAYKYGANYLPFTTSADRDREIEIVNKIFNFLKKKYSGDELRGIPFYVAFSHTKSGPKILEINSRPGDPEIINILPLLKDQFVDTCFNIIEGNLRKVNIEKKASVVIYKAPPSYGGYEKIYPDKIKRDENNQPIKLDEAYKLRQKLCDKLRVYPASIELREDKTYALSSRTVAVLGIAETIRDARELSMKGIEVIEGGALWYRKDIASSSHIQNSINHMKRLRNTKR